MAADQLGNMMVKCQANGSQHFVLVTYQRPSRRVLYRPRVVLGRVHLPQLLDADPVDLGRDSIHFKSKTSQKLPLTAKFYKTALAMT